MHAACDLIAPAGTAVLAVEDGTIVSGVVAFWTSGKDTPKPITVFEVRVRHADYLVRYGEIGATLAGGLKNGDAVSEGQQIASVGAQVGSTMLHFEMYANTSTGELTQRDNKHYLYVPDKNYQRRNDLINPTAFLDFCDVQGQASHLSGPCQEFEKALRKGDWPEAYKQLNALAMFEMLPAMAALTPQEVKGLTDNKSQAKPWEVPRMMFALDVVQNRRVPATLPAGILSQDEAMIRRDAENYLRGL
jgi:hypothetical protein